MICLHTDERAVLSNFKEEWVKLCCPTLHASASLYGLGLTSHAMPAAVLCMMKCTTQIDAMIAKEH